MEKSNETSSDANSTSTTTTTISSEKIISTTLSINSETTANTTGNKTTVETTEDDYDNSAEDGKSETENIQEENDQKQEELEEEYARNGSDKASINLFKDPVTNEPALHNGHFALIFASTLIVLSVVAYIGLVLWRGRLEKRYGMRQRLVTEDAFYSDNNNDVRYFGL